MSGRDRLLKEGKQLVLDVTENGRVMWLEEEVGKIIFGVLCDGGKGGLQSLCSRQKFYSSVSIIISMSCFGNTLNKLMNLCSSLNFCFWLLITLNYPFPPHVSV